MQFLSFILKSLRHETPDYKLLDKLYRDLSRDGNLEWREPEIRTDINGIKARYRQNPEQHPFLKPVWDVVTTQGTRDFWNLKYHLVKDCLFPILIQNCREAETKGPAKFVL